MDNRESFTARKHAFAFLAFFAFALSVYGQTPNPSPEKDEVIRVGTDLIQTTVTVTDKNGRFVEGLKADQFQLSVDDKPAKIEFFEQINNYKNVENSGSNAAGNQSSASGNLSLRGRKVIFFLDDLHLSLDSLGRTRAAINHFIDDEMLPTDNVLIVCASGQLGFLQQFTDHKGVLRTAVTRLKTIPNTVRDTDTPPMPEYTAIRIYNGDRTAAEYYVEELYKSMKTKEVSVNINALFETVKQRAGNIVSGSTAVTENTLGSLGNLMEVLGQNSGERKIVFFISDGFYLESKSGNYVDNSRLQGIINFATRSGSVFYTIDARGLFSLAADATGERPIDPKGRLDRARIGESTAAQEGLFTLANETGGRFLKNQNYFEKWVERILDESSSYYLLAWSPEKDEQLNKKFKRVEISVVGRPELGVRLHRGYLTAWEKTNEKTAGKKDALKKKADDISPAPPKNTTPKKNLPTNLSLNYLDAPNIGGMVTSSVQIATDALDYGANRSEPATIDLAGIIFNDQGKKVADFRTGLTIKPPARSETANSQSVIYNNPTPLAPGLYQVKIAAREMRSGQVGSAAQWIEIPDLSKRQLTLGSLLLNAKAVKKAEGADALTQVQYSVDHRFTRPFSLSFLSFIYNAARGGGGETNLATQIEVFDINGKSLVSTPMRPLATKSIADLSRIPLSATFRETMAPGTYLLRITVNDAIANTKAVQQTLFTVE